MTPEQLSKMSPEEKRIRIAELCGWNNINTRFGGLHGCYGPTRGFQAVPDYLNDLNAMNEAELANEMHYYPRREMFGHHLMEVCRESGLPVWMATAAQRADAFLLVKG